MSTNRIQYVRTAGVTVTVGLLLALAVQVGLTAAATGTSGATSSMALQGAVSIHLWGPGLGPGNPWGRGRFTISGAISDRGAFVNHRDGEPGRGVRKLFGAKGTIQLFVGHYGSWRITKGTGAYAGLHGRGTGESLWHRSQAPVEAWMEGTVSK